MFSETWEAYDPLFIDDPELRTGKHRTIITLPSLMGSVIPYFRPSDLKRELNEKFRQKHPNLDPSITLSQIRKVKQLLLNVAVDANLELSSVAKAYAYFEKLLLKVFSCVNVFDRSLINYHC